MILQHESLKKDEQEHLENPNKAPNASQRLNWKSLGLLEGDETENL